VIRLTHEVDQTLLVLDDEAAIRRSMARQLERRGYTVRTAGNCHEAEIEMAAHPIALILCDIDLPDESGITFVQRTEAAYPDIAVVMVTGLDDPSVAEVALGAGAYGYIIKPFETNELIISVANALRRRTLEIEHKAQTTYLEHLVWQRTEALRRSHEDLVQRLVAAADYRDPETATHLQRMSRYSAVLARLLGQSTEECELLRLAAPMHDIGKLGIPDEILCKPGRFTDADRRIMQQHTEMGYQILSGSDAPLIQLAAEIALTHHEWFDGSGYPRGLRGEDISLAGRIVAIADVFDALCTKRRYKPAMAMDEAFAVMVDERGHFDSRLLALFCTAHAEIEGIRAMYSESFDDTSSESVLV
jgi:putative two-component system response regulator